MSRAPPAGGSDASARGQDGRGISTAVDVVLAILLVSGSLVLLVGVGDPPPDRGTDPADRTADLLGSTTASVDYSLSPGARHATATGVVAFDRTDGPAFERHAHGTVAELLARAAVADASLDGTELSRADRGFRRAVRAAVLNATAGTDARVQVRAVWRPYRGAPLRGAVIVGDAPRGDATVHAATVRVPVSVPSSRDRAVRAASGGYGAVARVVAARTVRGLFEPEPTWLALRADQPVSGLATYRYRQTAGLLGADVSDDLAAYDVAAANERLTEALAARFEQDMRRRFETPTAAASTVSTGVVVITVRTWSP